MLPKYKDYKSKYKWMQWVAFVVYLLIVGAFAYGTYYSCVMNSNAKLIWAFSIYVCAMTGLFLYPQIYSLVILLRNLFTGDKIFLHYDQIVSTTIINNSKRVALVYCCKDDFIEEACKTALKQDCSCQVFILDDSVTNEYIERINKFRDSNNVIVVRRTTGEKNKAGNINNFLSNYGEQFDYVGVLDSDTYLTRNFVSNCLKYFNTYSDIGIVQGCSYPLTNIKNHFQDACTPNYLADKGYWANDAVATTESAITLCIGHGCMYNIEALDKIGGYIPDCVAEDTATSVSLLNAGYQTVFACNVMSMDETPPDFRTWKKRYLHWEVGNFDFNAKYFGKVLKGKYSFAYKLFINYWTIASWMTPFLMFSFNILAFACYYVPFDFYPIIPWINSIIFTACCAAFIPQKNTASKENVRGNIKHTLTLSCAAMSIMPSALLKFFTLFFTKKSFKVTNKQHTKTKWYQTFTQNAVDHIWWIMYFTFIIFTCIWTKHWLFAVNPIIWMQFIAYISLFIIPYMNNKQYSEAKHNELYKEVR